jgi:hypothetical protein
LYKNRAGDDLLILPPGHIRPVSNFSISRGHNGNKLRIIYEEIDYCYDEVVFQNIDYGIVDNLNHHPIVQSKDSMIHSIGKTLPFIINSYTKGIHTAVCDHQWYYADEWIKWKEPACCGFSLDIGGVCVPIY